MSPTIRFFDAFPFTKLRSELIRLSAGAERCEAAIAFVTKAGCELIRTVCDENNLLCDLVASVRFPTDLPRIVNLSSRPDVDVHIHTGYKSPREPKGDRGQFHSKLVIFSFKDGRCVLIIGSHNWTANGLDGDNLEASVIVHCDQSDPIALQARRHFLECKTRSHPLDPSRLNFYQAVQKQLHCSPGALPSQPLPGFEPIEAVVLHAELAPNAVFSDGDRLFLPVDGAAADFFPDGQRVRLILHPPGSLFNKAVVSGTRQVLDGNVTLANTVRDAPVTTRSVEAEIQDLRRPIVTALPNKNIPPVRGEAKQVIARFESLRSIELPVFHSGASSPKLVANEIQWRQANRDELVSTQDVDYLQKLTAFGAGLGQDEDQGQDVKVDVPQELAVVGGIKLPARWMYQEDLASRFRSLVYSRDLVAIEDSPEIRFLTPSPNDLYGDFIYRVHFECSQETIAKSATQKRLEFD